MAELFNLLSCNWYSFTDIVSGPQIQQQL